MDSTLARERRLAELFALPPTIFVASRDDLARRLRVEGDRDGAAAVKALRRPSVTAWVVNRLAHDLPAALASLAGLGEQQRRLVQRRAPAGEQRAAREAVREAVALLCTRAAALLAAEGLAGEAVTPRVAATLEALAAWGEREDRPRPGRLVAEIEPPGFEALLDLVVASPRPAGEEVPPSAAGAPDDGVLLGRRASPVPTNPARPQLVPPSGARREPGTPSAARPVSAQAARHDPAAADAEAAREAAAIRQAAHEARLATLAAAVASAREQRERLAADAAEVARATAAALAAVEVADREIERAREARAAAERSEAQALAAAAEAGRQLATLRELAELRDQQLALAATAVAARERELAALTGDGDAAPTANPDVG